MIGLVHGEWDEDSAQTMCGAEVEPDGANLTFWLDEYTCLPCLREGLRRCRPPYRPDGLFCDAEMARAYLNRIRDVEREISA